MSLGTHPDSDRFLRGGGEMGELTRSFDWASTSIGSPHTWPQSLRTIVGTLLNSRFPMFLWWGDDLIQFYNDAYRPSLGNNGKHPKALGQCGADCWPEIWKDIKPLIDQVKAGGTATWAEDQLLPIYRNGKLEDVYWTFSYSAVIDENDERCGILVVCSETTGKVHAMEALEESANQLGFAIDATELGTWDFNPVTGKFIGNHRLKEWFGLPPDGEIPLTIAIDVIAEDDRERVSTAIATALQYASGGNYDIEYTISSPAAGMPRIVRAKGKAWFNPDQAPYRFNGTLQDITEQTMARRKMEESEQQARSLVEQSPVRTVLMTGEDMIVATVNEPVLRSWNRDASVIGKPLLEVLPEMRGQAFPRLLAEVYTTGKPYAAYDTPVTLTRKGMDNTQYYDFTYQPMRKTSGEIYGVLSTAVDATERVKARMQLEKSERNLRNIILQSPVAMSISKGPGYVVEIANERMFEIWGRRPEEILDKAVFEAMPETRGQGFEEILNQVYNAGETFRASEISVNLSRAGKLETVYLDLVYEPIREGDGSISGIMQVAIDVSQQVLARKKIEAAEASLRSAIDVAELGTWSYDIASRKMSYSQRMLDWYGFDKDLVAIEDIIGNFVDKDQVRHQSTLDNSFIVNDEGVINDEHTIVNRGTGRKSIIHSIGKLVLNDAGEPLRVDGTSRDVTMQRNLQHELESLVRQRTEELTAANEELHKSNSQLLKSNEELAQYAYVASHDLQEPLRKIQMFSGLLDKMIQLPGDQKIWVEKISQSSARMSGLIQDLLNFSRLLKSETLMVPTDLSDVMSAIINDFELLIEEKHAQIDIGPLPVVEAVGLQVNQLFYNLVSNSLKFTAADRAPLIKIAAEKISPDEVRQYLPRPTVLSQYFRITVSDNGIGFEPKYADQIFEVFKRLHSREVYPGSGVGLALCRRIVNNHNGHMYVDSELGKGTSFHIILPEKQAGHKP